jgi:hypothetical protein
VLSIDFTSLAEKWSEHVAMSRRFRVKEVMRHEIASVTRLRMTNEEAVREGAAKCKLEMKLFHVEEPISPGAPMSEFD